MSISGLGPGPQEPVREYKIREFSIYCRDLIYQTLPRSIPLLSGVWWIKPLHHDLYIMDLNRDDSLLFSILGQAPKVWGRLFQSRCALRHALSALLPDHHVHFIRVHDQGMIRGNPDLKAETSRLPALQITGETVFVSFQRCEFL